MKFWNLGQFDQGRKMVQAIGSLTIWVIMAVGLMIIFYDDDPWYVPNASVISCISLLGDDQSKSEIESKKDKII